MTNETHAMRDVFIERLYNIMHENNNCFFVAADFGSPKLDQLRSKFKNNFINVGIAEQNMINVSTGLALEGYTVYSYAIAAFITMRAYEQVRINVSLHSQIKELNINLIGVGAGLSYDMSGPSHHCLEDISIIRTLPHIMLFSPSDWVLAKKFVDYSVNVRRPKYLRFDSKPLPNIYDGSEHIDFEKGFYEFEAGERVCLVSTGYMTHKALKIAKRLKEKNVNVGVIDVFMLRPFNEDLFFDVIKKYGTVITMEEAFIGKGGLDNMVMRILSDRKSNINLIRKGFKDAFVFELGGREHLHKINNVDEDSIIEIINGEIE